MPVRLLADYASLNLRYPGMLYIHFLFIFSYTKEACFTIRKNGSQILRIQRGGIRNKSHRPARTFVQVSNGYISARTRHSFLDFAHFFTKFFQINKGIVIIFDIGPNLKSIFVSTYIFIPEYLFKFLFYF